jgi:threonine efflux protein
MTYALALAGLAFANMLGIISPGPAFLMVSRAAAGRDLRTAVGLAAGVALAAASWAAMACFGIAILISQFRPVYETIELAGGAYLIWLGIGAWRHSGKSAAVQADAAAAGPRPTARGGIARAVLTGAMLSLGNPKIVIFFSSIFVALLPADAPLWLRLTVVAIVAVQEITWYTTVAFAFSRPSVQAAYRRASTWIERALGTVLIGLGARILVGVRGSP